MSELLNYRKQIDTIDHQILALLAKRFEVVEKVGLYKKANNIAPLQVARWQEVLENRKACAESLGLSSGFTADVWNLIHEYALSLESRS